MLIRYGYLRRIKSLFDSLYLTPKVQSIHLQTKRKNDQEIEPRIKKQYKKQIKTIDIHSTDDLKDVEFYFEKGVFSSFDQPKWKTISSFYLPIFGVGLRKVRPYYYKYQAFAKGRWMGRSLIEVFATEFRDQSRAYYVCIVSIAHAGVNMPLVAGFNIYPFVRNMLLARAS